MTAVSLPPLALEQELALKELLGEIPLKEIETADLSVKVAKKDELMTVKDGKVCEGNVNVIYAEGSVLQAKPSSEQKSDLARSPVRFASDKTPGKLGADPKW